MKYALVDNLRREPAPGLFGTCPSCRVPMIAKCGEVRVWHWAHRGMHNCDHWWEPETEWHREWKNRFPDEWQEYIQWAQNGEKHIADVRTEHGAVIEFQHSYLKAEERRARETFYANMVWVVDGLRRIRDKPKFFDALRYGNIISPAPLIWTALAEDCALLRDWADSRVPVLFDFGETGEEEGTIRFREPVLWHLDPKSRNGSALLLPIYRANFVEAFRTGMAYKGVAVKFPIRLEGGQIGERLRSSVPTHALSYREIMARRYRARSQRRF